MRKVIVGIFLGLLLVAGLKCAFEGTEAKADDLDSTRTPVEVVEDKARGVVCYIPVPGGTASGISCVYDPTATVEVPHE